MQVVKFESALTTMRAHNMSHGMSDQDMAILCNYCIRSVKETRWSNRQLKYQVWHAFVEER
jgi:hypothetical protein